MHGYRYGYKNDYNLRIPTRGLDTFRMPVDDDGEASFLPFELDGAVAGVADVDDEVEADGARMDGGGLL